MLATVGSLGDLHPFIALGLALKDLGADVVLASAADYRAKVEGTGLAFEPVRPSFEEMQRDLGMDRAQMTRAVLERSDFLFRKLILPRVRESYDDMLPLVGRADMVLTSSLAFGARLAAERCGVPWIAIVLQPLMFLSAFDPPVIPKAEWLTGVFNALGPRITRLGLTVVKEALGMLLGPVRRLRKDIGLAPSNRNPLFEGQCSEDGAIGLYSPLLGGVRADYPQPTTIAGFASFDSHDGAPATLDAALEDFLQAGAAPLVFTLGSLIVNSPGSFYRQSLSAARLLQRRAVLLVGEDALPAYAACRSRDVFVGAYAPHSLLFSRAAVVTHHGGIGTLAQALGSGRPQLIVPFFADQLDNAVRAAKLRVARVLAPGRYAAATAARDLGLLMSDPKYGARAGELREALAAEDGARAAAATVMNRLESRAVCNDGVVR